MLKIIHKDSAIQTTNLQNLSSRIETGCQIFELKRGKEIYLGVLTERVMTKIILELSISAKELYGATAFRPSRDAREEAATSAVKAYIDGAISKQQATNVTCDGRWLAYYAVCQNSYHLHRIAPKKQRQKENQRQGKWIINYLKSPEYLFDLAR